MFLPQVADMCACVPAPPVDMAGGGIVVSSCTYPGNTLLLYIPQFDHFPTGVETYGNEKHNYTGPCKQT
jgi:hypothetical protein